MKNLQIDSLQALFAYLKSNGASLFVDYYLEPRRTQILSDNIILILAPIDQAIERLSTVSGKSIEEISLLPEGINILTNHLSSTHLNRKGDGLPVYVAVNGSFYGKTPEDLQKLKPITNTRIGNISLVVVGGGIIFADQMDQLKSATKPTNKQDITHEISPKLRIASLNMAYNVMGNTLAGTERPMVKLCQATYPSNNGWADATATISQCTLNSISFLTQYDLFGLQEINKNYGREFENRLKQRGVEMNKKYEFSPSNYYINYGVLIGYDTNVMGNSVKITPDGYTIGSDPKDMRGFQAIYFPKHKLIFINLHAPHNINLEKILNNALADVSNMFISLGYKSSDVRRVIMVRDFNDYGGSLSNRTLTLDGFNIRIPAPDSIIPKTCCADTKYRFVGDYIMDSKFDPADMKAKKVYFGLPPNYDRSKNPYSDHDPVVLIEN